MSSAGTLEAWRFGLRTLLAGHPRLYLPLARWKYRSSDGAQAVGRDTDVVIEGFPRSANTFAVVAFRLAQDRPFRIAHHLHAPAQVLQGVRYGIPVLVLIRDPVDAVRSFILRKPEIGPRQAFRTYIDFYRRCTSVLDHVCIAPFEQVTRDFGEVIGWANAKFRTAFTPFDHSRQAVERVYAVIEDMNRTKFGDGAVQESGVARPSRARDRMKRELNHIIDDPALLPVRNEADQLYEAILAASGLRP